MSPLFRLLFGHLVGDFVLQTIDLVRFKSNSWRGLFLHSFIVIGSMAIFLWGDLPTWWPWLIPLFFLHYLTDWLKIASTHRVPGWHTRMFLLDQAVHIVTIVGIIFLSYGRWPYPTLAAAIGGATPQMNRFLLFLTALLISLFVVPLLEAQGAHKLATATHDECVNGLAVSIPDRLWGGGERLVALVVVYLGWPAICLFPLAFLPRVVAIRKGWQRPDSPRISGTKIAVSAICMALIAAVLWFGSTRL